MPASSLTARFGRLIRTGVPAIARSSAIGGTRLDLSVIDPQPNETTLVGPGGGLQAGTGPDSLRTRSLRTTSVSVLLDALHALDPLRYAGRGSGSALRRLGRRLL